MGKKFFDNMKNLNVRKPNILACVTEYIQEIFDLVDAINTRGYAFEDNGYHIIYLLILLLYFYHH